MSVVDDVFNGRLCSIFLTPTVGLDKDGQKGNFQNQNAKTSF